MSSVKDEPHSPEAAAGTRDLTSSDSGSERDTDTFEDAPDSASIRSLTKRSLPSQSPPPPASPDKDESELETETEAEVAADGNESEKESGDEKDQDQRVEEDSFEEVNVPIAAAATSDTTPTETRRVPNIDIDHEHDDEDDHDNENDLDTVTLSDDSIMSDHPPAVPEKEYPSKTSALGSFPWSPSSATSEPTSKPVPNPPSSAPLGAPPQQLTRKLTSPFSWLSRGSAQKEASPLPTPSTSPRRNTASSVTTMASNPEMMLSKLDEEGGVRRSIGRKSLKDRFKIIRMREEAGIIALPDELGNTTSDAVSESGSPHIRITTTRLSVPVGSADDLRPASPIPTSPNPSLAPGTVSGVTAGPSSSGDASVDWDMWQSVIYEGPAAVARSSPEELNRAIATGIPNAIRGVIWQVLAQSKNEELEAVYQDLLVRGTDREKQRLSNGHMNGAREIVTSSSSSIHSGDSGSGSASSAANGTLSTGSAEKDLDKAAERKKKAKVDAAALNKLEKAIRRDLGARTSYSKFAAAQGLQEGLFGVCKAYALFDEAVGYAQGMNFLIMPILFNMPEEEAFCLLVRLMNQYHLRDLFIHDMPGLHKNLYMFERLLEDLEPALYCHLHRRGVSPHLYATQWFLTLFAYRFPLQLVLRIYDLILSEGLSAILKFGVVLMQKNAATLLGMSDMSQLTTFLKDRLFDVYIDASPSAGSILENGFFGSSSSSLDKEVYRADQFVRDACEVKLTPELVKAYTAEWEEKTRTERERETELDHLRSSNASLTRRVRKYEERLESGDREQTALATELVHTKVQNEELRDENESLKGQVRELKVVIEKQPEELELAWQAERDSLMERNTRVHEDSLRVEKEMSELEEQLVQTKMRYAEINSQYETLSRKWSDLKRQFA
ncbi:GTPase activating protein [Grosmannia clavigera kw1407]|uniref:GTPase-activating protein GYP5 n=1 Tax=Grosmannia clavigera (strain kw1407 / UAMH 11150) TaxID=655863 RepID=F0X6L8_GROCL|nr:GTPase activating protein [Grosmannia clavigera kw1407]EFX06242.1 GTPase activating protein [Grosmannia clavigera kw1407]